MIDTALTTDGCEVVPASNGEEPLSILEKETIRHRADGCAYAPVSGFDLVEKLRQLGNNLR